MSTDDCNAEVASERASGTPARCVVGVRTLCEFTARQGDLDLRYTLSPSAEEGSAGHRLVASRRPHGYRSELALVGSHRDLTVRGRADGYDPAANRLDEVKTHRGPLARMPANHRHLHWAQAKVYGALLCRQLGLDEIELALVYFELASQAETVLVETWRADRLQAFFETCCDRYLAWARQEAAHAVERDASLEALRFPHAAFRAGQRALSVGVYRAVANGRCLAVQAPTGIGKTIATVFPVLKAWPSQRLDKVCFLTAKGSGRGVALDAFARLRDTAPRPVLRVLELVARDKACEHPDKACHGESCPLARGFYDRLPAARQDALDRRRVLDRETLRRIAAEHAVCPHHLGQELARWADAVVGDYNHYFDRSALLHALTVAHEWRTVVLVDEAHNLLGRARAMYSAALVASRTSTLRRTAPARVAIALGRLERRWEEVRRTSTEEPYRELPTVPPPFVAALQAVVDATSEHLADSAAAPDPALLDFHFDALHFLRLFDAIGDHTIVDIALGPSGDHATREPDATLTLRNLLPAPHLRERFAAAWSSTLFSATLTPLDFHRDTLGLPAEAAWLDVEAPFAQDQLSVRIAAAVSTRYRDRVASLGAVVDLIARQYAAAPGNYLAFFGSFEYLDAAAAAFVQRHPDVAVWAQTRSMTPDERDAFLGRFSPRGAGIGFAVLGGVFAEGIDLPGRRLVGAFVATLGLPPFDPVNERIRERMEAAFGPAGHDYAYLYPGMQKVVQAVGRVIRTPEDRGVVHLIDDRYARPEVRRLFPAWWRVAATAPLRSAGRARISP